MSNSSRELTVAFYSYVAYIGEGIVIIPANLLVAFSILRYMALRRKKEYIVIMALAFADAINMLAYLSAGSFRIWKWYTHPVDQLVTPRYCLGVPHILLWSFSDMNATLMLVVVSVDRLVSVAFPLKYIKLTRVYAHRIVLTSYGFTALMGAIGYYFVYNQPQIERLSVDCYGGSLFTGETGLSRFYGQYYHAYMAQSCALMSIIIFACVPPVYTYQKSVLIGSSGDDERKLAQQRKITVSMAISCVCTLMIFTIPYRSAHVFYAMGMPGMAYTCWTVTNCNSLANICIYALRHHELRMAIKNMLICKEMPAALNLWITASQNPNSNKSNHKSSNKSGATNHH